LIAKGMLKKIFFCFLPLVLCSWVWIKDGCRFAFWMTSVSELKEIPLVDGMPELGTQTQIIWKDQFVSGLETPLLGLVFTVALLALFKKTGYSQDRSPNA
jgi:hypothetical protein